MALNNTSYFIDSVLIQVREIEVPDANFSDGMNEGASNACGLGINTGGYGGKYEDWTRPNPLVIQGSQVIGGDISAIFVKNETYGDNALVSYVPASGDIAPQTLITTVSGFGFFNETGDTIPDGDWAWGVAANP